MAVSIRLRREGAKNRPYYKIVVADSRSPRDGKFIEIIGTYDPKTPGHNSTLKLDRAEYWISRGAEASDTVRSLIKKNKKQASSAPAQAESETAVPPAPEETTPASPEGAAEPPGPSAPAETAPEPEPPPVSTAS